MGLGKTRVSWPRGGKGGGDGRQGWGPGEMAPVALKEGCATVKIRT